MATIVKTFFVENWINALWAFAFLASNALLVACELALIKVRFSHFNPDLVDRLKEKKRMRPFFEDADRLVRSIRLGVAFCVLGYGLLLVPFLYQLLGLAEGQWFELSTILPLCLAFLLAWGFHYVFAELVPRGIGLRYPLQTLSATSFPVRIWAALVRPLMNLLRALGRPFLRMAGVEDTRQLETLDLEAQLEMLGEDSTKLPAAVQRILRNTLNLRDLVVADVLLPRNQVMVFDLRLTNEENLAMAREAGHTRFPLCDGDLDHCIGLVHIKDLFRVRKPLEKIDFRRHKRDMIRVDAEELLEVALTKLLVHKVHMALVIDEFRGVTGVLTLERILEQLVGDIRDEFDADEEVLIRASHDVPDEIVVSGVTPLHEIGERLGLEIDNEEVSTVSGLITAELGRIPEMGETVCIERLWVEVTEVDETRVLEARLRVLPEADEDDAERS
jgi:CBS domain containing-hemolysin-like protein